MKSFMNPQDFLLSSDTAQRLYHEYAAPQPIFDYHCHLSPKEIAENRQFSNLAEIWLEGDHYKWRAERSAGVPEQYITGDSTWEEKYQHWAKVVPQCIGNPIYHWVHLELAHPFGVTGKIFSPETAGEIWNQCNALLATDAYRARGIMQQMNVKMVGTTDDPIDDLQYHAQIAADSSFDITVAPTFRPDRVFKIERDDFADYIRQLGEKTGGKIESFGDLKQALLARLQHFDEHGCKASDHGMEVVRFAKIPSDDVLTAILQKRLRGEVLSEEENNQYTAAVLVFLGKQYSRLNWVMQYHIGAIRNNNSRMFKLLGADTGFDSIGDRPFAESLSALLDNMDQTDELPKTILYCLNPSDNEMMATMIGNFQGGGVAGKIQFGSGWWFNDQKDGMERQLQQLSQLGLLSQFVGMLTDSRSFLSYTRHEYFRRILCEMLGKWVENGEAPNDMDLIGGMVKNICYGNAKAFFK
ncbi:glucuronate isomerase [Neisseria perflava]|uniref:glucuronate isomerase n=1 Tax=Neisseria perflava TaxID=33053 RepID=UPI00209F66C4|nr:glucuronate isomerase [Neisseria perflava]MCP1661068.1 glucuronate isomerase [Neisseria perflava]MCP1771575.1 glucuronate isomerase [Neisseria perflava]